MIENAAEKESPGKSNDPHTGSLLTIKPAGNQKSRLKQYACGGFYMKKLCEKEAVIRRKLEGQHVRRQMQLSNSLLFAGAMNCGFRCSGGHYAFV